MVQVRLHVFQRLINNHNPERVLFITYRQALARDSMTNFGQLDFNHNEDSYEVKNEWGAPTLIIQWDSLMHLVHNKMDVTEANGYELLYDLIVFDDKRKFR